MIVRIIILLASILIAQECAAVVTDDFNRANNVDLGANWDVQTGVSQFNISTNAAVPSTFAGDAGENYNATTLNADQYALAKITVSGGTAGGQNGLGLGLRMSAAANTLYFIVVNKAATDNVAVGRFVAGTFTGLALRTTTWVDGDVLRAEVSGTGASIVLKIFQNGAQLGANISDASGGIDAAGRAGVYSSSSYTSGSLDDWEAGDLVPAKWSSVGTLGSVNSETANQSTLVLTTTAACEAANTCVCAVAVDNNQTTDGDEGAITLSDSASNTWTKLVEFTNGQGTAQTGATAWVGYTKATTTIASGGTITATFTNSASRDASAMTCWGFSNSLSNYTLSSAGTATLATDGLDPGAITISGLTNAEYLWLHGLAAEGQQSDAYTWDADYTQFDGNGTQTLGNSLPTYFNSGTFTVSATTCTAPFPASTAADDIALLVVESENEANSLSTANGFVEVTNSPQGAGTAASDPANRISVYWKRLVGGDSSPIAADSGNHTSCQIHVFRGVKKIGNPWDVTAGGNDGGNNDTTAVIPGATTTKTNNLIALIQGTSNNATSTTNCGTVTNADLANITERTDNSNTQGLGGGHCLITGEKATAGAYADSTLTMSATTFKGAMSIALTGDGVAASNMHVRGGFRIFVGTTDTVDVTSTTADRDYAQVLAALLATAGAVTRTGTLTLLGVGQ